MTPVELHDRARLVLGPRPTDGGLDELLAFHLQFERVSDAVRSAASGAWADAARLLREAADLAVARVERATALLELAREAEAASVPPTLRSRAA